MNGITALAPGVHVLHANPELAAWHGEIIPDDTADQWHRSGDVHVTWVILRPDGGGGVRVTGWYEAAAIRPEVTAA